MTEAESATWLVKSNGRILGPYSAKDVVRLLESRTVVALDEVSSPAKRWNYIRDTPAFSMAVEEIRIRGLNRGNDDQETATQTQEIGGVTETKGITKGITDTNATLDDLTVKISLDQAVGETEIDYEDIEDQIPKSAPLHRPEKHFGIKRDNTSRSKNDETTKFLWIGTVAILLVFVGFLVQKKVINFSISSESHLQNYVNEGVRLLKIGDEEGALQQFKEAHKLDSRFKDIYIFLGGLFTQLEGQTLATKRLFKMVLERQGKNTKEALTGLGLAELEDGELEDAEIHFEKALEQDSLFAPALINLGIVQQKKGEYFKAKNSFEMVIRSGQLSSSRQILSGITHLMLAESYLLLWEQSNETTYLSQAETLLKAYMVNGSDFKQHMVIYLAYIRVLLGQTIGIDSLVLKILDIDSQLTELHRHSLLVYRRNVDWNSIFEKCRKVVESVPSTGLVKALHAYCFFRNGNFGASEEMIVKANLSLPNHPLVKSTHGAILIGLNKMDQASLMIGKAKSLNINNTYEVPFIFQARLCDKAGDYACSIKEWEQLLAKNPRSLQAIGGSAENLARSNKTNEAWKMIRQGEALSLSYIPLLRAKDMLVDGATKANQIQNIEDI